jgi:signal peptidase
VSATQVHPGQVILYNEPGNPGISVTHRVVKVVNDPSGRFFITKGDANGSPDPWHVKANGVGWVVSGHVPYLGYAMVYLESTPARLLLVTLPALALGAIYIIETWRPRRPSGTLAA